MDDFERGAREMQRVAAEAMDALALQAGQEMRAISKGLDHAHTWMRLREKRDYYTEAAKLIRSIKIQDAVSG